jgi:NADPH:quinone reductase-like Zn-dependent oxidoreductase
MSETHAPTEDHEEPERYEIRLKGYLDDRWAVRFEGLKFTHESDGTTILCGPVVDQSELHGLLRKVRDLGIPLLSVMSVEFGQADASDAKRNIKMISNNKSAGTDQLGKDNHMKAIVYAEYGSPDVLQLKEVEKPSPTPALAGGAREEDEVLVKIHAASVNPADWHLMRAEPFLARLENGLRRPKNTRLGVDIAGRVEAIGKDVTQFQPGDEVFGEKFETGLGGFADYVSVLERALALKPTNVSFEAAAAVPLAALTALQGLRNKGQIQPGQKILINGASGGVGTFAVQIAKALGTEVTGVCSTRNLDMVRSIGADHVVDYTKDDFTRNGGQYDLIFDAVGNRSVSDLKRALSPNGICVIAGFTTMSLLFESMVLGPLMSMIGSKKIGRMDTVHTNKDDLLFLKELLEAGKVVPVIDRCYPLSETAEAIRYLETGRARGKVIIMVA